VVAWRSTCCFSGGCFSAATTTRGVKTSLLFLSAWCCVLLSTVARYSKLLSVLAGNSTTVVAWSSICCSLLVGATPPPPRQVLLFFQRFVDCMNLELIHNRGTRRATKSLTASGPGVAAPLCFCVVFLYSSILYFLTPFFFSFACCWAPPACTPNLNGPKNLHVVSCFEFVKLLSAVAGYSNLVRWLATQTC